jgi:hypothetical protein
VTDTKPTRDGQRYEALLDFARTALQDKVLGALVQHGSQNAAAAALGWDRARVQSALRKVQGYAAAADSRAATDASGNVDGWLYPPADGGHVTGNRLRDAEAAIEAEGAEVPAAGHVAVLPPNPPPARRASNRARPRAGTRVYLLTAAQNNTYVHGEFLTNLEAYARVRGATIMVSRFTYNKSAFGKKSAKTGKEATAADRAALWYDPRILPYVCDDVEQHGSCRWQLAPDLLWCAEMNILPTAVHPLSGLESYAGSCSGIFPHAKIALESVPVTGNRPPKFNYTTGAVTQRNYIAKKEGLKGEFHHQFGALVVEVDEATGDWWARQINATDDGSFYDLGWRAWNGTVTSGHAVLALQPGDIHASEIDPQVADVLWGVPGKLGALDVLHPTFQFWHDTFSHRNRGHHEYKSVASRYEKWHRGELTDSVEAEVKVTAALLQRGHRDWCRTIVVSSNHDRHLDRWLEEADWRNDPVNAKFWHRMWWARLEAIEAGRAWDALEWAVDNCVRGCLSVPAEFLPRDSEFLIGPDGHQVDCGSHGDEGPNGARGNAGNLSRMAMRRNVGHAHSACIRHGLKVAGVCNRKLPYAHGPSSWSVTHTVTYTNGKGALLTQRGGKLWL